MLEPERLAGEGELLQQRLGEPVVVVPGDEDHLTSRHRLAQLFEERPGLLQHRGERQFAQLEDVAEQDEALGAGEALAQRAADVGHAQEVLSEGAAEVQVGDDRRAHRGNLTGGANLSG